MSELAAPARFSATSPRFPSTSVTVVCLFCLLGLVVTAAIIPLIPPEQLSWVLAHIE